MQPFLSRRSFLSRATTAACAARVLPEAWSAAANTHDTGLDFPLVDFHVHLDHSQLDQVLALSRERGVRFGIVEHAGTRENQYPVVLSNDEELAAYVNRLDGKPVFKGVQAEWNDWRGCFSAKVLARLDYVLTDAMTFPGKDGQRVKLWEKDVETRVDLADKQQWMDRYVQWHVEILTTQPIDIFANTSWLPAPLAGGYDAYWTPVRVKQVVAAAVAHDVALEISSSFKLPQLAFLKIAKAAGAKFSLGSNGRYPDMGRLDYAVQMARALKLTRQDIFSPAPEGPKAVQRRKL
jgi:histidinol phosphatase-like PHP family hydrolase